MKEACVEIILRLKSPNTIDPESLSDFIRDAQDEVLVKAFIFFDRIKSYHVGKVADMLDNTRYIFFAALMVASYVSHPGFQQFPGSWDQMFKHLISQTKNMPRLILALKLFQEIDGVKQYMINEEEYNAKVQYIQHEFITDKLFDSCLPLIHFRLPSLEQEWLRDLIQNSETIYPTLLITLLYLDRLISNTITVPDLPHTEAPHLTFVIALKFASDYMLDHPYQNKTWAELANFSRATIKDGCLAFIRKIDWNFFVHEDEFLGLHSYIHFPRIYLELCSSVLKLKDTTKLLSIIQESHSTFRTLVVTLVYLSHMKQADQRFNNRRGTRLHMFVVSLKLASQLCRPNHLTEWKFAGCQETNLKKIQNQFQHSIPSHVRNEVYYEFCRLISSDQFH